MAGHPEVRASSRRNHPHHQWSPPSTTAAITTDRLTKATCQVDRNLRANNTWEPRLKTPEGTSTPNLIPHPSSRQAQNEVTDSISFVQTQLAREHRTWVSTGNKHTVITRGVSATPRATRPNSVTRNPFMARSGQGRQSAPIVLHDRHERSLASIKNAVQQSSQA